MGELEEKENAPENKTTENQSIEAKETDKMLQRSDDDKKTKESPLSGAEEIINIPDSVTEDGNNKKDGADGDLVDEKKDKNDSKKLLAKEDREVKPKKIPIGGMKLPGFFTKSKPKAEGDGADGELLEKEIKEEENKEKKSDEKPPCLGDRIRNFFSKKKKQPAATLEDARNEPISNEDSAQHQKKGLLNAIKLPIANMIPRKKTEDDVELGGPGTKAGLASMETLDDSLKDQDQVDKVTTKTDDNPAKTKDDKDSQSASETASCWESITSYRCSVDNILITLGLLSFVVLLSIIGYVLSQDKPTTPPIRKGKYIDAVTTCGNVEGLKDDSAFAFRGIPYAIPPINEYRFKPAQVIDQINGCWNGTLKAHNSSNVCSQWASNGTLIGNEDCLYLDVITPHVRYENPLPVVVLIGADTFTSGSPNLLRPSARFARAKDVVFVRPNFRMGPLGFLATEALTKSAYPQTSGNYALTDIIACLKWIQLNIKDFGGDSKSITLFGHKTGGTLVQALITSKLVKDLYTRAWISSSSSIFPGKLLHESEQKNQIYMNEIECEDVDCLRNASVDKIWEAVPDTWRHYRYLELPNENDESESHDWLVLDGIILAQHPADVWKKETIGKPKLVIGTTAHESHNTLIRGRSANWTSEEIHSYIEQSKIGKANLTDEVIALYNASTYEALVSIISDIRTICPLLTVARQQPNTPFYVVTQTDTKSGFALAEDDADIQGILSRYEPHTVEQRRYVSTIQQLFYHFVSHGTMEQYKESQKVLNVGQDPLPQKDYSHCNFWISKDFVPRYAKID